MIDFIKEYYLGVLIWSIGACFTFGYAFMAQVTRNQEGKGTLIYLITSIFFWPLSIGFLVGMYHKEMEDMTRNIARKE